MKKILLSAILIVTLFQLYAINPKASLGKDLSKRVLVSEFKFTDEADNPINSISGNDFVKASCKIERTEYGTGKQDFVFFLVVHDGKKINKIATTEGTVNEGESVYTSVTAPITGNTENMCIQAFIWSDLFSRHILASSAEFGGDECGLSQIIIDGQVFDNFRDDIYEYNIEVPYSKSHVPSEITAIPKDYSSKIEITNMDEFPGTATVKVTSHSGLNEKTYRFNLETAAPLTASFPTALLGAKRYHLEEPITLINLPTSNANAALLVTKNRDYVGSTMINIFEFDLSQFSGGIVVNEVRLKVNVRNTIDTESVNINSFICTDENWKDFNGKGSPTYDRNNPINEAPVLVEGSDYKEYILKLDYNAIKDKNKVCIMLFREFIEDATSNISYVDVTDNIPILEIDYYEE